jgi:uncharacterized protein YrrD
MRVAIVEKSVLYRIEQLIGMSVRAVDGEVGRIRDVLFDDAHWALRHLVCECEGWLGGRKVLIAPFAVESINWTQSRVQLRLTRQKVQDSPGIDSDQPVSRQQEAQLYGYYGYPYYWGGPLLWGASSYPMLSSMAPSPVTPPPAPQADVDADAHLRSAKEVIGYHVETTTQPIGHVQDLLVDDHTWAVRYIVIDTRNWWPGKHVVIPPQWITQLDWAARVVSLDVDRDTVKGAPEFDPGNSFSRSAEIDLYRHYQRPGYWQ